MRWSIPSAYLDRLARNAAGLVGGDDFADQQSTLSATVVLVEQMLAARVELQVKLVVAVGRLASPDHRAGHLDARLDGMKAGGMMNTGERIAGAASTRHSRRLLDRMRAGHSGKDGTESNK